MCLVNLLIFLLFADSSKNHPKSEIDLKLQGTSWDTFIKTHPSTIPATDCSTDKDLALLPESWPIFLPPHLRIHSDTQSSSLPEPAWTLKKLTRLAYRYQWEGYTQTTGGWTVAFVVDTHTQHSLRARAGTHLENTSIFVDHVHLQPTARLILTDTSYMVPIELPLHQTAYTPVWEAMIASAQDPDQMITVNNIETVHAYNAQWRIIEMCPQHNNLTIESISPQGTVCHHTFSLENVSDENL